MDAFKKVTTLIYFHSGEMWSTLRKTDSNLRVFADVDGFFFNFVGSQKKFIGNSISQILNVLENAELHCDSRK